MIADANEVPMSGAYPLFIRFSWAWADGFRASLGCCWQTLPENLVAVGFEGTANLANRANL